MEALSTHPTPELIPPDFCLATLLEGFVENEGPIELRVGRRSEPQQIPSTARNLVLLRPMQPHTSTSARPLPLCLALPCLALPAFAAAYPPTISCLPVRFPICYCTCVHKEEKNFCCATLFRQPLAVRFHCAWTMLLLGLDHIKLVPKGRLQSPNLRRHIPPSSPRLMHVTANRR